MVSVESTISDVIRVDIRKSGAEEPSLAEYQYEVDWVI